MDIKEVFKQEYIKRCLENDEPLTGFIRELFNKCLIEVFHNSPSEMDQFYNLSLMSGKEFRIQLTRVI